MANEEHANILIQGSNAWNLWRKENPLIHPDLSRISLSVEGIWTVDFSRTNLSETVLFDMEFLEADFSHAKLFGADLRESRFMNVNCEEADFRRAILIESSLHKVNLRKANLRKASLAFSTLNQCDLTDADLTDCFVYGISAWDLELEGAKQRDLHITRFDEPEITVDNLELAQFIYLLSNSQKIRSVIDTISSKVVLILGRFTTQRKSVLNAIRNELRKHDYVPVLFDFEKPVSRDITETVCLLGHIARFIIADITDARSIPQELERIVPDLPSVPVQPLLQTSANRYGMFEHFERYPWVLKPYNYTNRDDLIRCLHKKVIAPAEAKWGELHK